MTRKKVSFFSRYSTPLRHGSDPRGYQALVKVRADRVRYAQGILAGVLSGRVHPAAGFPQLVHNALDLIQKGTSMVKKVLLFSFLMTMLCTSLGMASDFREAEWGMSKEQVKKLEKSDPLFLQNETLTFKGKVANSAVHIIYEFADNQLKKGTYKFTTNRVNPNVYLQDYAKVNEFLELKYGKPEYNKETWHNDVYKEKRGYHGLAIANGHLRLESSWESDKTIIVHLLSGNNSIIDHNITYYDKSVQDIPREKIEIEGMQGL